MLDLCWLRDAGEPLMSDVDLGLLVPCLTVSLLVVTCFTGGLYSYAARKLDLIAATGEARCAMSLSLLREFYAVLFYMERADFFLVLCIVSF